MKSETVQDSGGRHGEASGVVKLSAEPDQAQKAWRWVKGLFGAGEEAIATARIVAANGTKITGFTSHGIQRVVGDSAERAGVVPHALLDALKNPKRIVEGIDSQGRPFQVFHGADARVVVNPSTGKIVSVNPLSGAGAH